MKVFNVNSPELVEALASRYACELTLQLGLHPITFEVDSILVVQAVTDIGPNTSMFGRIYEYIATSLLEIPGASISHVYRASNVTAHKLARDSRSFHSNLFVTWSGVVPPEIWSLDSSLCTP